VTEEDEFIFDWTDPKREWGKETVLDAYFKDDISYFLRYVQNHELSEEEKLVAEINDIYPCRYYEFKQAQRLCVVYKFFSALKNVPVEQGLFFETDNKFFIDSSIDELNVILEILETTHQWFKRDLKQQKKTVLA
jgi:hypothetical protein